jgi:serine/threonine protein kinase
MNHRADNHLPDASDIGLTVLAWRDSSLQWQKYHARKKSGPVCAWRFWPHDRQGGQIAGQTWRQVQQAVKYARSLADGQGYGPNDGAYSANSESFWAIYPDIPQASIAALADPARLPRLIHDMVLSLHHLHQHGVWHLDVHPSHIVDSAGRLVLTGVGADVRRAAGISLGSNEGIARPGFSPPELCDASARSHIGPWTDVFSAAACIFQCITGQPPVDFRLRLNDSQWRDAVSAQLRQPLQKFGDNAAAIESMIVAGLEPAPQKRPRTITEWNRVRVPERPGAQSTPLSAAAMERSQAAEVSPLAGEVDALENPVGGGKVHPAIFWLMLATLLGLSAWFGFAPIREMWPNYDAIDYPTSIESAEPLRPRSPDGSQGGSGGTEAVDLAEEEVEAAIDAASSDAERAGADALAATAEGAEEGDIDKPQVSQIILPPQTNPSPRRSQPIEINLPPSPSSTRAARPAATPQPSATSRGTTVYLPADTRAQAVTRPSLRSGSISSAADFAIPLGGRAARSGTSVEVEFVVGTDGVARNCRVTRPGHDPSTDQQVCALVTSRLRFNPARTADGTPVEANYGWRQTFTRR